MNYDEKVLIDISIFFANSKFNSIKNLQIMKLFIQAKQSNKYIKMIGDKNRCMKWY